MTDRHWGLNLQVTGASEDRQTGARTEAFAGSAAWSGAYFRLRGWLARSDATKRPIMNGDWGRLRGMMPLQPGCRIVSAVG